MNQAAPLQTADVLSRCRVHGRIGGAIGEFQADTSDRLSEKLGSGAHILRSHERDAHATKLVVDWDSCWLDQKELKTIDDWRTVLNERRLAEINGAFVLASLST